MKVRIGKFILMSSMHTFIEMKTKVRKLKLQKVYFVGHVEECLGYDMKAIVGWFESDVLRCINFIPLKRFHYDIFGFVVYFHSTALFLHICNKL